jgi:hypothetical protein
VRLSEARGRPGGAAPATTTAPIVDPTRPIDGWAGSVRAHMNTEEILDDIRLRIELMPLECGPGVTIPALPPVDRHNPPKVQQRQLHPEGPISVSSPRSAWTAELVPNMRAPRASSRASASPDSEVSGPGGLPDRLPGASGAEGRGRSRVSVVVDIDERSVSRHRHAFPKPLVCFGEHGRSAPIMAGWIRHFGGFRRPARVDSRTRETGVNEFRPIRRCCGRNASAGGGR